MAQHFTCDGCDQKIEYTHYKAQIQIRSVHVEDSSLPVGGRTYDLCQTCEAKMHPEKWARTPPTAYNPPDPEVVRGMKLSPGTPEAEDPIKTNTARFEDFTRGSPLDKTFEEVTKQATDEYTRKIAKIKAAPDKETT